MSKLIDIEFYRWVGRELEEYEILFTFDNTIKVSMSTNETKESLVNKLKDLIKDLKDEKSN